MFNCQVKELEKRIRLAYMLKYLLTAEYTEKVMFQYDAIIFLTVIFKLQACNHFRLYNGAAAESEIRGIVDQSANAGFGYDLVRHNLVVFRSGQGAMPVS